MNCGAILAAQHSFFFSGRRNEMPRRSELLEVSQKVFNEAPDQVDRNCLDQEMESLEIMEGPIPG